MNKRVVVVFIVTALSVLLVGLLCLGSFWILRWSGFGMMGPGMPGFRDGCCGDYGWIAAILFTLSFPLILILIGVIIWLFRRGKTSG